VGLGKFSDRRRWHPLPTPTHCLQGVEVCDRWRWLPIPRAWPLFHCFKVTPSCLSLGYGGLCFIVSKGLPPAPPYAGLTSSFLRLFVLFCRSGPYPTCLNTKLTPNTE
jgi:hypothetical protein